MRSSQPCETRRSATVSHLTDLRKSRSVTIMQTVSELYETLGRANLGKAIGVKQSVLSRAKVDGIMPTHWYFPVKRMCDERGIKCPEKLFRTQKFRVGK